MKIRTEIKVAGSAGSESHRPANHGACSNEEASMKGWKRRAVYAVYGDRLVMLNRLRVLVPFLLLVSAEIAWASPIGISIVSTVDVIAVGSTTTDDPAVVTSTGSSPVGSFSGALLASAASLDATAQALVSLETSWAEVSANHFTLVAAGGAETLTSTSDTNTSAINAVALSSVEFTFTLLEPHLFFTIGHISASSRPNAEALYTLSRQGVGDVFALSSGISPVPFDLSGSLPAGTYTLFVSLLSQSTSSGPSQFLGAGGDFDIGLDLARSGSDPTPAPVPEPGTLVLLGVGIGGMAARRLRRAQAPRRSESR
jgi:hypothetical protein